MKPNRESSRTFLLITMIILVLIVLLSKAQSASPDQFGPDNVYRLVEKQLSFGPRFPGSPGHQSVMVWIAEELNKLSWQVEKQSFTYKDTRLTNIIAKWGNGGKWIILGTHYDTRRFADMDLDANKHMQPVPGANDGASGVAALLQLARSLSKDKSNTIWLAFFDAEDQGGIDGWDWIVGSTYFARSLTSQPDAVVIVDMIGDRDLTIYQEGFSNIELSNQIWSTADRIGHGKYFFKNIKHSLIDDHLPFINQDIPAALIIDFDYPFWHTTSDNEQNISMESIKIITSTLHQWVVDKLSE